MGKREPLPPLPLSLAPPHLIPPAPTRDPRALAFLPDLGGLTWVAYAAGPCLVVSHLPSPPRRSGDTAGDDSPFFRQVIDLRAPVSAVAWCGRGGGELAASAANSVSVFQPAPDFSSGSFGWLLRWSITETFAVAAVVWTGSGDGIVAVGAGISMWARTQSSWQLAWRSTLQVPQSMVSTTRFLQGPVATVAAAALVQNSVPVVVFLNDPKRGLEQAELVHPQPVCMIQWRPWPLCATDQLDTRREILMTSCLDGTVRLWSENEVVRTKKQHGSQITFSVITVIEVNSTLNGVLGVDIAVRWPVETGGVVMRDEEGKFDLFSGDSGESQVGKCEWLVSVGPGPNVNFWAIHCLDDISPPRYPRITPWKQSKLHGWEESNPPKSIEHSIFIEAVISRRLCSSPPTMCSLLHFLADDSFIWSCLSTNFSSDSGTVLTDSSKSISCCLTKTIQQNGHQGSIRQVAVHPYSCEIELAVSMDSNGMLFFWSLSTFSTLVPTLHASIYPLWKLLCKFDLCDLSADAQYSCLCWAPSVSHHNRFLVLGGENEVDCLIVRIQNDDVLSCHKIFTIPFLGESNAGPPDSIHTIPLASNCSKDFVNNSFLVVCIWRKRFQVFSWKVDLHSKSQFDKERCSCGFAYNALSSRFHGRHITCFGGEIFAAVIYEGSSVFPIALEGEYPTCISVMSVNNTVLPMQQHGPSRTVPGYHIATGCSDGSVKLWKMSSADDPLQSEKESHSWELVGTFGAHQGPISAISLSSCGRIATVGRNVGQNSTSIHIWEAVKLMSDGAFLLEDALTFQGHIVGLDGTSLGDGRFLLAVYLPNELHIYSPEHPSCQTVVHTDNSKAKHLWRCIAFSIVHHDIASFLWGPKATIVLVHENHLSLLSSWLVKRDDKYNTQLSGSPIDSHEELPCSKHFNESIFGKCKLSENQGNNGHINSILLMNKHDHHCSNGLWNLLDIADELSGPLASYHPRALVQYLYSGEWKRANAALEHLVKLMKANETSKVMSECSSGSKSCRSILELPLSEYFTDTMSKNISNKGLLWGENRSNMAFNLLSPSNSFSYSGDNFGINATAIGSQKPEIDQLLDMNFGICAISDIQRTQILAIRDLMSVITDQSRSSPYKSLDEAGRRFWVAVQLRHLYAVRDSGDASSNEGCRVDSASIAWALQSDCQDDLLNSVLSAEPTWPEMQNLGIGLWYNNVAQLRTRMEKLARSQYLKRKDPKDCALLYIALNRINVLVGLFKISRDEKDKRLYEFLSRNFQEERHKAAALKNAYVLMGRHQWDLAIAFFLLGGDTSSAVTVCAKNLLDEQLAIVICRLLEGSGGPLERNLISSVLLPGAVEKGDHWLASLLEWTLGNYWLSINKLFGFHTKLLTNESKSQGGQNVFADPEVGQYCAILATKNSFRNCVGEVVSANLSKLSVAVAACALNKCGLPLEALECLSCNACIDGKDSTSSLDFGNRKIFDGILGPFPSSNWLSSSVVTDIELNLKVTMASKYLSRLLRNHSLCSVCNVSLSRDKVLNEHNSQQTEELERDVMAAMLIFDKRFSLKFTDIAEKMLIFCCYDGLLFLAYVLLWGSGSQNAGTDNRYLEGDTLRPIDYLLLASCKESCKFLSRYAVFWCLMCFILNVNHPSGAACTPKYSHNYIIAGITNCMDTSRLLLKHDNGKVSILDNKSTMLTIMSLLEYIVEFYLSWLCRDIKALLIKIHPVLTTSVDGDSFQVLLDRLVQAIQHTSHGISSNAAGMPSSELYKRQLDENENSTLSIHDKWHLIGISLWIRLSSIMKHYLKEFVEKERLYHEAGGHDLEFKDLTTSIAAKFIVDSLHFVSSSLVKLYASLWRENLQKAKHSSVLFWLENKSHLPRSNSNKHDNLSRILQLAKSENLEVLFNILWETYANPVDVLTAFVNEEVNCYSLNSINLTRSWKDVSSTVVECEKNTQRRGGENKYIASSKNNEKRQGFADKASNTVETSLEVKRTDLTAQKDFQTPKELLRRSGELLEAICLNSINEKQVAIATNRKGLLFFNWSDQQHSKKLPEYVWSRSDWPLDCWAGCESTPTPTFISSSAGLGRRSHLGSGGATSGLGSLAKPGRDLTGGGAFGIPGYAGIGASGFGWGEPEEFEDFVDPPATLENIHSRALSRHPSLPLLLVGSSNTHVYLWEFGKESAMATYGVLRAANIPPPYALASISAVQFDYYGHRFATAALDGTVCTWQVEVGGRSNVNPTVSSLCFNTHASDVTYVATSGSVVAAAGCNSNGANVAIWDTLAPPATCLTSITCHEGGARSISVFDSDIGCGSISPLIVTGGKSGDVALHDFRFVSTGKSKNRRISTGHDIKASSIYDTKSGTSGASTDGMIWHIPKAHLGSVTKVLTIPNTSLFLTGSKDGDVKLWDAKNSQLVFHWPKLHERHTFFQPTSRGFGGVVRAGVTDIQVLSHGFISCGGDGSVKLVWVKNNLSAVHQR